MNIEQLRSLAERLEKAMGPDDALLYDVANIAPSWREDDEYRRWFCGLINARAWEQAALTLVERLLPGWMWNVGENVEPYKGEFVAWVSYDGQRYTAHAPTPALAILRALVAALIAKEDSDVQAA